MSVKVDYCSVEERDMDTLFLEAMGSDKGFLKIFLNKVDELKDCDEFEVQKIQLSKMDNDGESDITVIIQTPGKKYGILIEDKINAIAMDEQCNRYSLRGKKGIKNGDYDDFFVFIVAPQKYYDSNEEAKKYDHYVSYEECKSYLENKNDSLSKIWVQQFEQAIDKAKKQSNVTYNPGRMEFLRRYIEYKNEHFTGELDIANNPDNNGAGGWVHYRVKLNHAYILHKAERGFMDLTFSGAEEKKSSLFELMESKIHQLGFKDVKCFATGKSMSYRIVVPIIDFDKPFDDCNKNDLNTCFEAAIQLTELARIISYFGEMCSK
ncbi:MAG: hypothetical protein MJ160_06060 [Treponema sp.]|nr:hypothetical protein [Treponema sp.]